MRKFLLFFTFILSIISPESWSMEDSIEKSEGSDLIPPKSNIKEDNKKGYNFSGLEEKTLYKIKQCQTSSFLKGNGKSGRGNVSLIFDKDETAEEKSKVLWYLEKKGEGRDYFILRNFHSGLVIKACGKETGENAVALVPEKPYRIENADHRIWYVEKQKYKDDCDAGVCGNYKIFNAYSSNVLACSGKELRNTVLMEPSADRKAMGLPNQIWQFIPVYAYIEK